MASTEESAPPSEPESVVTDSTGTAAAVSAPKPVKKVRMPVTVAETIHQGKSLRIQKSTLPKKMARPPPKPAFPKGYLPGDRDVKMSRRAMIRQARCLRKHNIVLSDRMDELSRPTRRQLIALWRTYADILTPEQINNLQNLLDANDPFKPDQAYEYFIQLRKQKKKDKAGKKDKKQLNALCGDRRFAWVRSATVAFARGIQRRLGRPGNYELEDGLLRLSDIVLAEICAYCKMRPPSRRNKHPKARFMQEMSDKIAVWIDEILAESDERLLMMDFDEDDEVRHENEPYTDDFLNMMAGKGRKLRPPKPAYLKFTGEMLEAFLALTDAMYKKGDANLVTHGKSSQTYKQGADELRQAADLNATMYDGVVADEIAKKMDEITQAIATGKLQKPMKDIIDICSKYLAQLAEYNKDKGPAFKYLVAQMRGQPNEILCVKGKVTETMGKGADDLDAAKGLETDHDDPKLTTDISSALGKLVKDTPADLRSDMSETVDTASKYLSQKVTDENERGPVFDKMIHILKKHGGREFVPECKYLKTSFEGAQALQNAPGLTSITPDPATAPTFQKALHKLVDPETPTEMLSEMADVIKRSGDYLSGFARDRGKAQEILVKMMRENPDKEVAKRNDKNLLYGQGAQEFQSNPILAPILPVGDIHKEAHEKLDKDVANETPEELKGAMKALTKDVGGDLSQDVALISGSGGDRYDRNLVAAAAEAKGDEPLFKTGPYGMTYADAGKNLRNAGELEKADEPRSAELSKEIARNLAEAQLQEIAPATQARLQPMTQACADHLAKVGIEMNDALTYLLDTMTKKGEEPLANIQGMPHSYNDAVKKIARAPTLNNDNVDKGVYENISSKLKALMRDNPKPEYEKRMPAVIEDVSKFLAKPIPTSEADKKELLHDLLNLKRSQLFHVEGKYKMTYGDAAEEVLKAPTGGAAAAAAGHGVKVDEGKIKVMEDKLHGAVDDVNPKLQSTLEGPMEDTAHHLAEVAQGRGEAMGAIHKELEKKGDAPIATYNDATLTHGEGAKAVETAPNFSNKPAPPGLTEDVNKKLAVLPASTETESGSGHMKSTMKMAANTIAAETGQKGGYQPPPGSEGYKPGGAAAGGAGAGADGLGAAGAAAGGVGAGGAEAGGAGAGAGLGPGFQKVGGPDDSAGGAGGADAGGAGAEGAAAERAAAERAATERAATEHGAAERAAADAATKSAAEAADKAADKAAADVAAKAAAEAADKAAADAAAKAAAEAANKAAAEAADKAAAEAAAEKARQRLAEQNEKARAAAAAKAAAAQAEAAAAAEAAAKAAAEAAEAKAAEEERQRRLAELRRRLAAGERGGLQDKEHEDAKKLLVGELVKRGDEDFYRQNQNVLSHGGAAKVLEAEPETVDKSVREAPETDKLAKKFERKLNMIVDAVTPVELRDAMTDVIVESARPLAEHVIAAGYASAVKDALIDGMQKKDNEIFVEDDGELETYFYAAQRLKKEKHITSRNPHPKMARELAKKLDACIKCRAMPRKLAPTMRDHVKQSADYLSEHVFIPDPEIDALIDLLYEMEDAGNKPLVGGKIPKTQREGAEYLKSLTSFEDKIGKPDPELQAQIEKEMQALMSGYPCRGYTPEIRNQIILQQAGLLTSYLKAQGEKVDALNELVQYMDSHPDGMILRHGSARKSFFEAVQLLHGKNPDHLQNVQTPDPIVARKLQIRLNNVMARSIHKPFMSAVIDDVTNYLAVHLLHPPPMKVCKCLKSVFVQCELWNEETLRGVTRPCCTCSQGRLPGKATISSPGVHLDIKECPTMATYSKDGPPAPCPAVKKEPCPSARNTYIMQYEPHFEPASSLSLTRLRPEPTTSRTPGSELAASFTAMGQPLITTDSDVFMDASRGPSPQRRASPQRRGSPIKDKSSTNSSFNSCLTTGGSSSSNSPSRFPQSPWTMFASTQGHQSRIDMPTPDNENLTRESRTVKAPIVTTDQMSDLYAMMVSLMWNMQAWRGWLQEKLDLALTHVIDQNQPPDEAYDDWVSFQKKAMKEALQWRQYIKFSQQLTRRLEHRYRDKEIVSPTRASNKTRAYLDCQREMFEITDMFNKWTQWLAAVLKESETLQPEEPYGETPLHVLCWNHFKGKVEESIQDWMRYKTHLNICWEHKYKTIMSAWEQEGPVWVMSACGAVPSGAVSAGTYNDEIIWVARTTHKSEVLPAALLPSKHCCLVYADGAIHCYTKYQVLCNADAQWIAWRAGGHLQADARAVCVAPGVHVGRVEYHTHYLVGAVLAPTYRCHVVIHSRPIAFECFDLLVMARGETTG